MTRERANLTVKATAARLCVSTRTVWRMLDDGTLTPIRLGQRIVRVDADEVERVIEQARQSLR